MAKLTTPKYNDPKWDESKYRKGISTKYYTNAIKDYTGAANLERSNQISDAQSTRNANLRQAYVSRLQNEQAMNRNLATAGIRGGATETANLRMMGQYGQARNAANTDYASAVTSINRATDQNIRDYTSDMNSRAEEYRQNMAQQRWQADRDAYRARWEARNQNAVNRYNAAKEKEAREWQAKREDKVNKQNQKTQEKADLTQYWSNFYVNYYSGYKKKDVKKAIKRIEKNLNKAKTWKEKIRWQQAMSGAKARLGVINNK